MSELDAAVSILRRLRDAGHVAYLAGGCVRDSLLGLEPKDYDIATDARPEQVRDLFRRSRYVGEAFGVCLVHAGGQAIEVATFRSEWGYTDRRRPDHVAFTDAAHDARRRDFTINGLFADPLAERDDSPAPSALSQDPRLGRVIDHVGGVADLRAGLIRAIGDADARFAEDYLRMLRAVRFAARLGFEIESGTAAAIRPLAKYLGQISRERIGAEVGAMLRPVARGSTQRRARAVALMKSLRLDGVVLNEDHRDRPTTVLERLDPQAQAATAMTAWAIDRHADEATLDAVAAFVAGDADRLIARWRTALSLSNDERDAFRGVLTLTGRAAEWDRLPMAQRKRLLAEPGWPEAARLLRALADRDRTDRLEQEAAPLLAAGVAPPAWIGGDDLIRLGLKPGPDFGRYLEEAYDAQLEGRVASREEALAWLAARTGT